MKTVKEWIALAESRIESAYKNILIEKNKEISELKQKQLYKEDFEDIIICHNCDTLQEYCYAKDDKNNYHEYYRKVQFKNNDYWKYDTLPSKEELK